jgi:16S rRNA (guanine527-N7)-methyltransferase
MNIDEAVAALGIDLSPGQRASLTAYRELLLDANTRMNLTAIRAPDEADSRLIAESLAIVPLMCSSPGAIMDVGSGGGIPGIPLAIALPDSRVDLVDATAKKVEAMQRMCDSLELSNARAIRGRSEELARDPQMRGRYTVVTARAVARLATLVEYTLPFLQAGGIAVLPKGESVHDEVAEAREAIEMLGGRLQDVIRSPVNQARFVVIEQLRLTPSSYPRRTGIPAREPIGVPAR